MKLRTHVALVIAIMATLVVPSSAGAASPSSVEVDDVLNLEELATDMYSREFGVSQVTAGVRLNQQEELSQEIELLRNLVGPRLAGAGFNHTRTAMSAWLAVTGTAQLPDEAVSHANHAGIELRYGAAYSLDTLRTAADDAIFTEGVIFIEVDEENNSLRIGVDSQFIAPKETKAPESNQVPIIVETVDETPANATLMRGGEAMTRTDGNNCTSGFAVRNSSGTRGILTAGHCSNSLSQRGKALKTASESFNADLDAQWHQLNSGDTVADDYLCNTGPHSNYCDVTSVATPAANQFVCHYGYRSGISCGNTTSVWSDPGNLCGSGWASNCDATFIRMTGTYLKGCGGDSGGPTYQPGGVAYGIFKAVTDVSNCTGQNKIAWSTRLDEVASHLSVTVLTS